MNTNTITLCVNEIFYSLQGETTRTGFPSLFIRLAGCNLNCRWCDTPYARTGSPVTIAHIIQTIEKYPTLNHITITGGEPLMQEHTLTLLDILCRKNYPLQLETNGSISIEHVPSQVHKIVDVKTPSSGHADSFNISNIQYLKPHDEIKFVIADDYDYNYSKEFMKNYLANVPCVINFSPVWSTMVPQQLAEYILHDRLNVRLNIQLHKILWHSEPKHF
ncbi:MAG: radical SAM protein [Spirochaetes bacterium]|nr:radical SAM protein [Spirochaetota bacterium]